MTKINQKENQKATDMASTSKKTLNIEEMKLRQEKPIFGGGIATSRPLKKAKQKLIEEKTKVIEISTGIHQKPSEEIAEIIKSYDSLYSTTNQEVNIDDNDEGTSRLIDRRSASPNQPMEDDGFEHPKRYSSWSQLIQAKAKQTFGINTENKYDSLSSDSEEEQEARAETRQRNHPPKKKLVQKKTSNQRQSNYSDRPNLEKTEPARGKKAIPPPLVLKGELKDLNEVKKRLKEECGITKVNFKYTRYNTLIMVENEKEHGELIRYFKRQQVDEVNNKAIEFHTYTPGPKKTHAFVVRGLDFKPEPEEVKAAFLHEYEIETSSVYQMHTKYRPLFMIVTSSAITQKYLQNAVKYLMNVRVYIEERQNVRRIIQCHRCQGWGHATSNCYRDPKCLKCAEGHFTKNCTKSIETDPKCCNCGGKHPANALTCRVYQAKLSDLEGRGKKYVPAPLPEKNAWQRSAENSQNNETQVQRRTQQLGVQAAGVRGPPPQQTSIIGRSSINENIRNHVVDEVMGSVRVVEELNKKINFRELNRALNDLNLNMKHVKTGVEAFQVYYQFIESLESKYHILN